MCGPTLLPRVRFVLVPDRGIRTGPRLPRAFRLHLRLVAHVRGNDVAERRERREVVVVVVEAVGDVEHRAREQLAQCATPQFLADPRREKSAVVAVLVEAFEGRHVFVGQYLRLDDVRLGGIVRRFADVRRRFRWVWRFAPPPRLVRRLLLASDFALAPRPAPQRPLGVEVRAGVSGDAAMPCVHDRNPPTPWSNPAACASSSLPARSSRRRSVPPTR